MLSRKKFHESEFHINTKVRAIVVLKRKHPLMTLLEFSNSCCFSISRRFFDFKGTNLGKKWMDTNAEWKDQSKMWYWTLSASDDGGACSINPLEFLGVKVPARSENLLGIYRRHEMLTSLRCYGMSSWYICSCFRELMLQRKQFWHALYEVDGVPNGILSW